MIKSLRVEKRTTLKEALGVWQRLKTKVVAKGGKGNKDFRGLVLYHFLIVRLWLHSLVRPIVHGSFRRKRDLLFLWQLLGTKTLV